MSERERITEGETRRRSDPRTPADSPQLAASLSADRLTPEAILRMQSAVGNRLVGKALIQRDPDSTTAAPALPSITHLPAMAQTLLKGALEKTSIDAAVRQIYDNMFQKTGWKYNASISNTSGPSYIKDGKNVGMCESYRNAFAEILRIYDGLRPSHPDDRIKNGVLKVVLGNDLATQRFTTRTGLTLMGDTKLKGNVYLEVDGRGNVLDQGIDSINTFVFLGHWTLKVNGREYDPIFHSIDEDNVETRLDQDYADGAERFLADTSNAIPTGEFGATFVHVTDFATFQGIIQDIETLYKARTADIEALLGKSTLKQIGQGIFRPKKSKAFKGSADIFRRRIEDRVTFAKVVGVAYNAGKITRDQKKAFDKLSQLTP
jgi:hypothetical protein